MLPKAEERAREAGRAAAAHVEIERRAQLDYLTAARDSLPAMTEAAEAELARVGEAAIEHLEAVNAALVRGREVQVLLRALDPDSMVGREPSFTPARQGKQARRGPGLSAEVQGHVDGLRSALGGTD
jgi:hypothetical protein